MAVDFASFVTEIEGVLSAQWTDIQHANTGGGIFEVDQIQRIDFERIDTSPYAVVEWNSVSPSDRFLEAESYEVTLTLHRAQKITAFAAPGGIGAVRDKIVALSSWFMNANNNLTSADLLDVSEIDVSDDHPANAVFIAKGMPWVAGSLSIRCLLTAGS